MIPVLFRVPEWIPLLGGQPVTSFGVMLLASFVAAGTLFARRLERAEPGARAWELVVAAAVGGILGAKLLHLAIHGALGLPSGGLGRAGLDWFGGLAGGALAVAWQARRQGLRPGAVAGMAAGPVALGQVIGRLGSFLVGADYGVPTRLPWGVAFRAGMPPTTPANLQHAFGLDTPQGAVAGDFARVHPTQLYEAALALVIFTVLERVRRRGRNGSRVGGASLFGVYLLLSGVARAAVELVRAKQDRLIGPVTVDLLLALATAGIGAVLAMRDRPVSTATEAA